MIAKILLNYPDVLRTYKSIYHGKEALKNYKFWFPLLPSHRLAGIVADLMCDGHVQPKPKLRLDYTSKRKKELLRFGKELHFLFGVRGKIRRCKTNKFGVTYNYGVNCKPLCRTLILCGCPAGNKQITEFEIPRWILDDKNNFRRFLERAFSCEGSVSMEKVPFVDICMYKSLENYNNGLKFFNDIKKNLLRHFDIETTKPFSIKRTNLRKDGIVTKAIRLRIKKRESLIKFINLVGIEDPKKNKRLEKIIEMTKNKGQ